MDLLRSGSSHSRRRDAALDADEAAADRKTPLPSRSFHFPTRRLPLTSRSFHLPRARQTTPKREGTEAGPEKCGYAQLQDDSVEERSPARPSSLQEDKTEVETTNTEGADPTQASEYVQLFGLDSGKSDHESMSIRTVSQSSVAAARVQNEDAAEMYGYESVEENQRERVRHAGRRDCAIRRGSVGPSSATPMAASALDSNDTECPEMYGYKNCHDLDLKGSAPPGRSTPRRPMRRASISGSLPYDTECTDKYGYENCHDLDLKASSPQGRTVHHRPVRRASVGGSLYSNNMERPEKYGYEDCHDLDLKSSLPQGRSVHHRPMRRASIGGYTIQTSGGEAEPKPIRRQVRRRSTDNRHQHQHPTGLSGRTRTTSSTLVKRRASLGSASHGASTTCAESDESSPPSLDLDRPQNESDSSSDDEDSFGGMDPVFHRSLNDSIVHVLEGLEALEAQLMYGYS
jgi:hypothetical protein